jgi:hypothetical protein
VLFGSIPLAIITVLLFTTPNLAQRANRLGLRPISSYGVIFTVVLIPYFAMPAVMTQDPNERSKISTVNIVLSTIFRADHSPLPLRRWSGCFLRNRWFPGGHGRLRAECGCRILHLLPAVRRARVQKSETQYRFRTYSACWQRNTPLILVSVGYNFYSIQYTVRIGGGCLLRKVLFEQ